MKSILYLAITAALSVFSSAALAQNWTHVTTKDTFVAAVKGKTLSSDFGTAKIRPNGKGSGKTTRGAYKLNWVWDNGRYCRNFRFGSNEPTGTICARIDIDGDKIRFSNLSGNQQVSVWTMK